MKRLLSFLLLTTLLAACTPPTDRDHSSLSSDQANLPSSDSSVSSVSPVLSPVEGSVSSSKKRSLIQTVSALADTPFAASVKFANTPVTMTKALAEDFAMTEVKNIADMEKAYGFTFTAAEKKFLDQHKFVMKPLTETNIRPKITGGGIAEYYREMLGLYNQVRGPFDPHDRGQQNTLFYSSDLFFHFYTILYTELLKEMENEVFFTSMQELSQKFYEEASKKVKTTDGDEQKTWRKVRAYFAVPYAILSTSQQPLTQEDYYRNNQQRDPAEVQREFNDNDRTIDTAENVTAFIKKLKMDGESEQAVLADIAQIYEAKDKGLPALFKTEYERYAADTNVQFAVDFTQFTPRSHYTSSSLRRQYFRAMNWYIQLPFFLKSPALTEYAFAISELLAENPDQLADYNEIEKAINFLVGTSDDLMPVDYLVALERSKDAPDQEAAVMDFLIKTRSPKIKATPAFYPDGGGPESADVLLKTKGMRFFSGKFIIDSYWTSQLTQGDESPKPGYTQKLPPMASSLEVMALLGSDYAKSKIPTLDFYKPETKQAIDKAMADLTAETALLNDADWQSNLSNGWLWTIKSLFTWQRDNRATLPRFMQSEPWTIKTLMTGAGFWTELRHATLLYAKQSFAELGGGGDRCDERKIPEPAKAYIEPQLQAYDRLIFLGKRTDAGLSEMGFRGLDTLSRLQSYLATLDFIRSSTVTQLENATLSETIKEVRGPHPEDPAKTCVSYQIDGQSDWEKLRYELVNLLEFALPVPLEGPVLPAKDKRMALVADVHIGGDSAHPHRILYEGVGVPYVIFVAVKDANGPRLAVGFTYAHFEFTEPYGGQRLTDEQWQQKFYEGEDPYDAFQYQPRSAWPVLNAWYVPLFPGK